MLFCSKEMNEFSDGHCNRPASPGSDFCYEHRIEHLKSRVDFLSDKASENYQLAVEAQEQAELSDSWTKHHQKTVEIVMAKRYELETKIKKLEGALDEAVKYFEPMEFTRCCNGRDCGCMGMPVEPEYYILQKLKDAR